MPTIQQQLNQLKKDKETLNTMLNTMGVETTGNETFTELTPLVGKIVTEPILQDKAVEITENGTQTITADNGYDGLNNVSVTTNVASSGEMPTIKNCQYLFVEGNRINETETILPLCTEATDMANMFRNGTSKIKTITGFANFKTNNTVSTESMFMSDSYLTSIDFTPNTKIKSNKTSSMFAGCTVLKQLDLSGFDFSTVTNSYAMFSNCKALEELDISSWDFTKVTNFGAMFNLCGTSLTNGKLTTVYVKDATAQDWVLNSGNGRPDTWTTTNVIIKN